jgi:4-hydroxybenzoate polyprenyltransferase
MKRVSSKAYLLLSAIFFVVSVVMLLFVHPVPYLAALAIGILLLFWAFYSMANERRWLD